MRESCLVYCYSGIQSLFEVVLLYTFYTPLTYSTDRENEVSKIFIAAAASEPEANQRSSSLISRRLNYKGLQSLFLTKRKELWLCANGRFTLRSGMCKELWFCANERFRMRSGMSQGIVVVREWEDLGFAAYQSYV